MASPKRSKTKVQLIFTVLFLFSATIYITVPFLLRGLPGDQPSILPEKGVQFVEFISLLTSIVSLFSLLSAMIIRMAQEKREKQKTTLNQRLQEIRISREKIALEREMVALEKIRAEKENN